MWTLVALSAKILWPADSIGVLDFSYEFRWKLRMFSLLHHLYLGLNPKRPLQPLMLFMDVL